MGKGFTFAQMATLILVIMGLTIVVVLAATQLARLSGQTTELSSGTDVGAAAEALQKTGTTCTATLGGACIPDTSTCGLTNFQEEDCPSGYKCCYP
jgi:hypothetical protein